MNIPGFTAETSLYKTNRRYRAMAGMTNSQAGGQAVFPQLPIGFCQANCDGISDPFLRTVCELRCFDGSGGGGGGGGGRGPNQGRLLDLACKRCHINCDKKPLAQRAACHMNCDDSVVC